MKTQHLSEVGYNNMISSKSLLILMVCFFLFGFSNSKWEKGKTDSNGNLIIVKLENRINCDRRKQNETISVDTDWSILLFYDFSRQSEYYLFNNVRKQIFKTKSFDEFIAEIKQIPNNTIIRDIGKCTIPFSCEMPDNLSEELTEVIKEKECTLEDKIMFCYCCAEKIEYEF